MSSGFRLGRIAGIDIHIDWSLLIIFFLISFSLGAGLFPAWHPDWSPGLSWITALIAAFLFFASVMAHELSHALVGRSFGLPVDRITLFIFGGVAHLEREPQGWRVELWTALIGPITSLILAGIFLTLSGILAPAVALDPSIPELFLRELGPTSTLFLWLGQINLILAIFNLVPGFPLDGGRVLRAILWGISGDLRRATHRASQLGRIFSGLLIGVGLAMMLGFRVPFFGTGVIGGLWLMLIGWFLNNAAVMSYRQLLMRESLEDVPVSTVMRSDFSSIDADMPVSELVDRYLLPGDQRTFPVLDGADFIGLVSLRDIHKTPRETWRRAAVRSIMTPADAVKGIPPQENAADAMLLLGRQGVNQLPVVEDGKVRGMVSREDILKLLSIYGDPALAD
jgi:Zn-dependent protease